MAEVCPRRDEDAMGKVTALDLNVVTERSGHVAAPLAVSVCTTPAAPAPVPLPYPVTGASREGIAGATMRTKIEGAPIATVGSALKRCHGNEPGTRKETLSLNTGGPAVVLAGAPVVLGELGMMAVTGSAAICNRGAGPTMRTAPGPMMTGAPGMCPALLVMGAGTDAGGAGGNGAVDGDGDANGGGDGGGDGADGEGKSAPSGTPEGCAAGHPVDVVTGRAFTLPAVELELAGPLPLVFARSYSSEMAHRDVGLGHGWAHTWGWEIEVRRRRLVLWTDEGIAVEFPMLAVGEEVIGDWGWLLRRERDGFTLDLDDGVLRVFALEEAKRWRLTALRDRNGHTIRLHYERGALVEVHDSAGRTIRIEPTRGGRIGSIQLFVRARWVTLVAFAYDGAGDLRAVTDDQGHTERYTYDEEHRLTSETTRTGLVFHFVYDRRGRCIETWGELPAGDRSLAADLPSMLADGSRAKGIHHVKLEYGLERSTEVIDSTEIRRYFGNRHGLLDKRVEGPSVVTATYDAHGHLLGRTDATGGTTTYERDGRGRVLRAIDPLGRVTRIARDEHGLPIEITDPAGGVMEIHRDAQGNVLHEADPTGATTSYQYDARGLVIGIVSPTGGRTRAARDAQGNVVERVDPNGALRRWTYDELGRCTSATDPMGATTRYAWSLRGDLLAEYDATGGVTRHRYDAERRPIETTDPAGRTYRRTWGHFHQLTECTDPMGATVRMRYNREGELMEVENARGEVHRFERDGSGRVVGERTFDGRHLRYKLDAAGRLVRRQCGPEAMLITYDAAGQLVERRHGEEVERFTYDALGAITEARFGSGVLRFERDAVGRIVRETQVVNGASHAVASTYDARGERIHRATTPGHQERIERDAVGARVRTILDGSYEVRHVRDRLGREDLRVLPRGGAIHSEHDKLGLLAKRWATSPSSILPLRPEDPSWKGEAQPMLRTVDRAWTYTAARELRFARDPRRGRILYEHDEAGRLLAVLREAGGAHERFNWSKTGELHEVGGPAREYGTGGRLLRRGEVTYRWDEAGRLVEKRAGAEIWRYGWDAAGRLTSVERPGGAREEYVYDPLGRRLEAVRRKGMRVVERTRFVWDQDTLAHAICARASEQGDPIVEVKTFCFEDEACATPWAQRDDGPDGYGGRARLWRFFVDDPVGAPEELLDTSGRVVAAIDRQAWGTTEVGKESTPLRFPGQYEDAGTGLFYNRFRYYDPEIGGYISADPLGLVGGLTPYGYVFDPLGWIDPFGLTGTAYDIAPHDKQPSPRPSGLASHHIVQGAWAKTNIPGYNYEKAPTMLLPKSQHKVITAAQASRSTARVCTGRAAYSNSARDELNSVADDYDRAGISEKHKRRAVKSAYKTLFP